MINPMYDSLPDAVEVNGKKYTVTTDFADWIRFADIAAAEEITDFEKIELYMSYFLDGVPIDKAAALRSLAEFYSCADLPHAGKQMRDDKSNGKKVFSFLYDSGYILAAFRQIYRIDLRKSFLHWYEFRWLFDALPDTTAVKERINYRAVNLSWIKDVRERRRIGRIQKSIALPDSINDADIGDIFGGMM